MNQHVVPTYRERDKASVLHPQTNLLKHLETGPTVITHGDGVYVTDDAGNRYLDSGAGLWCAALGYQNERVARVAHDAMTQLAYFPIFRHQSHGPAIDLSEKLLEIAPVPMSKVLLQCSGSEANDSAVKIVWYYWHGLGKPERRKIITRTGSYHGSTCVTISMTGNPAYHKSFGLPFDGFIHVDSLNYYRSAKPGETEEQFSQRLADSLEATILREGPETVAAFWADPVQGNAGALPPPKGYFEKIQAVLKKYDILFVADEVICGFGRTGEMWGSQVYDLKPDLLVCAKGLSAALLPISALLINEKIFRVMTEESNRIGAFVHGFTYAGHPVACAVALEVLKIYEEMDIVSRVKSLEPAFLGMLDSLKDHPLVGDATGVGLIGGLEIVADKATRKSFGPEVNISGLIEKHARKAGIILRITPGRIAYSPPLIITEDEIAEMGRLTRMALDGAWADVQAASA
ncbi:aminotransferase [Enterovirga rhinocerotis]|uniref:4-aminobutyrate--pyruvate transaminase n=1 Tax=Enterovirga rhinocerotis TaxID=1339210 RepID=A0A4R7C3E2_9HYPH|nr:aminotransferase [Enterovirga rhinocerotis]TDR92954.1 4-aminobutyrate--pyruvate transaminase [Enterovirga rhinocerotis]